ncbi:MAG: hypothetical protein ACYDHY_19450 [Acidiferrobacterales bacterium]
MSIISDIFKGGLSGVGSAVKDVVSSFKLDPTVDAQLKEKLNEAIMNQQSQMATLAEAQYEAQLKDVDSARQMEIAALKQESWFGKNYIHLLSIAVTLGFFGLLAYMVKFDVPAANKDILNIMLGSLGTAWISIVAFYFGSSKSSEKKDETIKQLSS